jgi:hypothetical protein
VWAGSAGCPGAAAGGAIRGGTCSGIWASRIELVAAGGTTAVVPRGNSLCIVAHGAGRIALAPSDRGTDWP